MKKTIKFQFLSYAVIITIATDLLISQQKDDPRNWSDRKCRKVARKINNNNEVKYCDKYLKVERIKALRDLTQDYKEIDDTWRLRAWKEWVERVFDDDGNIRI